MKILKHGKEDKKTFTCSRCGCVFEIDFLSKEDTEKHIQIKQIFGYADAKKKGHLEVLSVGMHLVCPECGKVLDDVTKTMVKYGEEY